MHLRCQLTNELPFLLELPNGQYDVNVDGITVTLNINSDCYTLHTSRFPEKAGKNYYVGEKDELIDIIEQHQLGSYAFVNCMTFVSCDFSKTIELSQEEINAVNDEDCIKIITSSLISNNLKYANLGEEARSRYDALNPDEVVSLKRQSLIEKHLHSLAQDQLYYFALNRLIREYSYLRGHFWVYMVDENVLNGTLEQFYINGKLHSAITRAGFAPTILPATKKYPEISDDEKTTLQNRLSTTSAIPIENELLLVARNLWYRREYRSAVIESSAALEIVVAKKIQEKMLLQGKTQQEIDNELKKTKNNFTQRCDHYLKVHTRKSFKDDNSILWSKIETHRNDFRHKIAHSDVTPDFRTTETIIKDFEDAIKWINAL